MKKIILMLLMIFLIVFAGFSKETIRKEFKVEKGKKLDVNLKSGGEISITGWEKNRVTVRVHFRDSTPDQWDIEFNESSSGIKNRVCLQKAKWKSRHSSPDFEIQVPVQFDLKLKTNGRRDQN